MNYWYKFTYLFLVIEFFACGSSKSVLEKNVVPVERSGFNAEEYSKKNIDSTKWSLKKLQTDLKSREKSSEVKLPLSDYPSPVTDYSGNGSAVSPLTFDINGRTIQGYTLAHYRDKYNEAKFKDTIDQYYTFFTILYATDLPNLSIGENPKVISRNYPHYLFTGTQNTSLGDIDWVQMTLASGENFAIITQRYFDLKFGRTILITPLKDGSIRLMQLTESPETYTWSELANQSVTTIKEFVANMKNNERVINFFSQNNMLDQR